MTRSVFVTSAEGETGKSTVAYGLLDLLSRQAGRIAIFRPVATSSRDKVVDLLLSHPAVDQAYDEALGVTYDQMHDDESGSLATILARFDEVSADADLVMVLGSDFADVSTGREAEINAMVAANLGAPVVLVVHGRERTPEQIAQVAVMGCEQLRARHATPVAIVVNRATSGDVTGIRLALTKDAETASVPVAGVIPEVPLLVAPTVAALAEAAGAELWRGNPEWLQRESRGFVVAAMSLPNVLTRLVEDVTVIAPGDRYDILPGLVLAHQSGTFPGLAAIVLTGGYRPPESVQQLLDGTKLDVPILVTDSGTFETTAALARTRSALSSGSVVKKQTALRAFGEAIDADGLLAAIDIDEAAAVTPLMFGHRLLDRARSARKHIVLPEGDDLRILKAADEVLRGGIAQLTILGDETQIKALASSNGLDISSASIVSPHDEELVEKFAAEYAEIRKKKGVTIELARETVQDVSYFGTMMVHLGLADGMVSGAAHTTAHTIKPSFEIIKTAPDADIVSSVFLMALADQVLVYGDCAVNPDPNAEQLADIAISSAKTASAFGIQPRVAMLSYSTGTSGSGADVEKVRAATELVRERAPELAVDGPIQYDAAVEPSVAKSKMPDSPVAGRATVLIFPDLNTGNNTYKAVQRSAGAVAMGPVLQGLNKPVNDLSRGALVEDIVNTIAITAVQAQEEKA